MNYHERLEAPDEECPHCCSAAWHVWGGRAKYRGRILDVPKDVDYFVCKTCSKEFFSTEQLIRFMDTMQAIAEGLVGDELRALNVYKQILEQLPEYCNDTWLDISRFIGGGEVVTTIKDLKQSNNEMQYKLEQYDILVTTIRNILTGVGIPDWEPYPDEDVDDYEKSLRSGGRMIPLDKRVQMLADKLKDAYEEN